MNASQSKRREERCGKWLTKKGKSAGSTKQNVKKNQMHLKPYVTTVLRPTVFMPYGDENKSCKMKQSTMSQFLVEKTSKVTKTIHKSDCKSISTSKDRIPVVLVLKKEVTSALTEYEDLWGSDCSNTCKTEDKMQEKTQEEKLNVFDDLLSANCKDTQIERSVVCTNDSEERQDTNKLFPSPKRFRKSKDSMDPGIVARNATWSNSRQNEVQFTEWFEHEVDAFLLHCNEEKNVLNRENLSSMSVPHSFTYKPSDPEVKEESTSVPHFSEWFNEQINKVDCKTFPAANILQSPARDGSQNNNCTFTQWFEVNLENIKS